MHPERLTCEAIAALIFSGRHWNEGLGSGFKIARLPASRPNG